MPCSDDGVRAERREMSERTVPAGALSGLRVADLSSGLAGALAAMLLADLGSEVIRIESGTSGSAPAAEAGEPMWHRHKTVMQVTRNVHARIAELLAGADVAITDGDGDAAIIGDERIAVSSHPRLIHLSLPSCGLDHDVDHVTFDALIGAAFGVASRQSSTDGGPVESVYPHLSYIRGVWAATAAVAALVERDSSGLGQKVTVDVLHGVLVAATTTMVVDLKSPPVNTAVGPGGPNPAYSTYQCSDGLWLFLGALTDKFQERAFTAMDVADVLTDPRIGRKAERLYAPENRQWVRARLAQAFASRPREECLRRLAACDCPAGPVSDRECWLDHPQMIALGQRKAVADPLVGPVMMPWLPLQLSVTPVREPSPRVVVDETSWSSLAGTPEPGKGAASVPSKSGPLAGMRVLDLGTVLAGPFAGMLLAELGADVVKIEPPAGDSFRVRGFPHNRGLRSLAVDLRHPQGHAAFLRLAVDADAVIDNYRPGVLDRLRISHDHLAAVRPDIVTASITAFGQAGPLASLPGFDPIMQAMSGIMSAQGGTAAPHFSTLALHDVTAACFTALGICAALHGRIHGIGGQNVQVSLAATSAYMQSGELVRFSGRPASPVGCQDYRGPSELSRCYQTADGFVRLHVPDRETLEAAGLRPDTTAGSGPGAWPEQALRRLACAEVIARLVSAGGTAVRVRSYADLARDPDLLAGRYLEAVGWPDGTLTYLPGRYVRFSRTEETSSLRPPGLGEHSRELLAEAGMPVSQIEGLVEVAAVITGGPVLTVANVGYR